MVVSVACLFAFLALGFGVVDRPPGALDTRLLAACRGHALPLAVALTQAGRFPAYVTISAVSLLFGIVRRAWLARASVAVAALALAWQTFDVAKDAFGRPRPAGQLVFHETSLAYPSGHATLALTFYGAWAWYVWRSSLPRPLRIALVLAAKALIAGIGWSRLALGAHFPSDVLGGYLLGGVFLGLVMLATRTQPGAAPGPPRLRLLRSSDGPRRRTTLESAAAR